MKSFSDSYRQAGVDITAGYTAVELMKSHIARTRTPGVVSDIGGFGGLFEPDLRGISQPLLVSGTDGVGTKLKIAFLLDKHDTVGQDCVAMCVNDVICCGARPLFFLDYIALGKNDPQQVEAIVSGVADGCVAAGCALIGGETAEMPGFYQPGEYDLAGCAVGLADRKRLLDPEAVEVGDAILALPSSGVHSNGFSLVRRVFDVENKDIRVYQPELEQTLGEALLTPTRIYVKPVLALLQAAPIRSLAHITGGGFYENIPRCLPGGVTAVIEQKRLRIPPIFELIAKTGGIAERDMFNTFNMGVGMVAIVAADHADQALRVLAEQGCPGYAIGQIEAGEEGVRLC